MEGRGQSPALPRRLSILITETGRQGFSWTHYAGLASQRAPETCLSQPLSSVGSLSMDHHAQLCIRRFWRLSSDPHACVASTLPMELSPHLGLVSLHSCSVRRDRERKKMGMETMTSQGEKWRWQNAFWVKAVIQMARTETRSRISYLLFVPLCL